jgi:hypothetical protein
MAAGQRLTVDQSGLLGRIVTDPDGYDGTIVYVNRRARTVIVRYSAVTCCEWNIVSLIDTGTFDIDFEPEDAH